MKYLLMLIIMFIPLFAVPNLNLRLVQELAYQLCAIIYISASFFVPQKRFIPSKMILFLSVLVFLFIFQWVRLTCLGTGWSLLLNFALGLMFMVSIIRTIDKQDIRFITKIFWVIMGYTCIYLGFQLLNLDIGKQVIQGYGVVPQCAFYGWKSPMGMYASYVMPILISMNWIGLICFFPIVYSFSSGAVLAGTVSIMFYTWFTKRILFWILLPILITGGILYLVKIDNPMGIQSSRLPMWRMVIQDSIQYPIGHGLDSFRSAFRSGQKRYFKHWDSDTTVRATLKDAGLQDYFIESEMPERFQQRISEGKTVLNWWDHPHNEFLWLFYEVGIFAVISLGLVFWFGWLRFWRSTRDKLTVAVTAGIISFFLTALTQFPLHLARTAYMLPILGAFFYILTEQGVEDGRYQKKD